MTEKIQKCLLDLKAAQDADQPMRCPRCGADTMKHPMATNALSRVADLYICDSCGNAEGLLAFMRHSHPLHRWSVFEPQKPDSDFKARPAKDVLAEILQTQIDKLENTFRLCRDDKENAPWHRNDAFESCAGLTDLILEPFHAKYRCADGSVLVQVRTALDGTIQMSAGVVDK